MHAQGRACLAVSSSRWVARPARRILWLGAPVKRGPAAALRTSKRHKPRERRARGRRIQPVHSLGTAVTASRVSRNPTVSHFGARVRNRYSKGSIAFCKNLRSFLKSFRKCSQMKKKRYLLVIEAPVAYLYTLMMSAKYTTVIKLPRYVFEASLRSRCASTRRRLRWH